MPALRDRVLPLAARGLLALPAPVHRALAGRPPAAAAGLAPDAWLLARLAERGSVPPGALPVDEARRRFALALAPLGVRPRLPLTATDRTVAGAAGPLSARLYVPHGAETPGPLLVYFHGGGWAEGSAATHQPSCPLVAHLAGGRVLSVDYPLAPSPPFPAAAADAVAPARPPPAARPPLPGARRRRAGRVPRRGGAGGRGRGRPGPPRRRRRQRRRQPGRRHRARTSRRGRRAGVPAPDLSGSRHVAQAAVAVAVRRGVRPHRGEHDLVRGPVRPRPRPPRRPARLPDARARPRRRRARPRRDRARRPPARRGRGLRRPAARRGRAGGVVPPPADPRLLQRDRHAQRPARPHADRRRAAPGARVATTGRGT